VGTARAVPNLFGIVGGEGFEPPKSFDN
jgi:hypothetical protein